MDIHELAQTVWKILSGMPIEVFDEDQYSVWENYVWELTAPRTEGDFKDSRLIGSANIVTAYNIVHQKLLLELARPDSHASTHSIELFSQILEHLQSQKLIRKKPHYMRQSFAVIK